jgi:hypothetical protein
MMALPPADHTKLVKVLGLLGSDHDGERASAAHKASEIIRKHRLTWADVLAPAAVEPSGGPVGHAVRALWIIENVPGLSERDRGFLSTIMARRVISAKQAKWLCDIEERVGASSHA